MENKEKLLKLLNNYYQVVNITVCECGAVTLEKDDDIFISFNPVNALSYFDGNLAVSIQEYAKSLTKTDTVLCNHCVNHWGIDLCKCGSGNPTGMCDCDDNGLAYQEVNQISY
jgi:hypothetical protein